MFKTNTIQRGALGLAVLAAGLLLSSSAFAVPQYDPGIESECVTDADCAEGQVCEVVAASTCACAPCESPDECPPCECPPETEITACVTPPVTCESDADCPDHLTCLLYNQAGIAEPCEVDPDGNSMCGDPMPYPEGGTCEFMPPTCSDSSDCDEGFSCEVIEAPCAVMCDSNGECDETCGDQPDTGGQCFPEQIACDTNADCPTDWTCYEFAYSECSGGGTVPACECPPCSEQECPVCECDSAPVDPTECTETVENYCIPAGWDGYVEGYGRDNSVNQTGAKASSNPFDGDDGIFRGGSPSSTPGSDDGGSSDSGGTCSVVGLGASTSSHGLLVGLLIGMAALVIRRR